AFGNVVRNATGAVQYTSSSVPFETAEGDLVTDNGYVVYSAGTLPVYDVTPLGTAGPAINVSHQYAGPGQYVIHAGATTALGTTDAAPDVAVAVSVPAPMLTVAASSPVTLEGLTVDLSGSVTTIGPGGTAF